MYSYSIQRRSGSDRYTLGSLQQNCDYSNSLQGLAALPQTGPLGKPEFTDANYRAVYVDWNATTGPGIVTKWAQVAQQAVQTYLLNNGNEAAVAKVIKESIGLRDTPPYRQIAGYFKPERQTNKPIMVWQFYDYAWLVTEDPKWKPVNIENAKASEPYAVPQGQGFWMNRRMWAIPGNENVRALYVWPMKINDVVTKKEATVDRPRKSRDADCPPPEDCQEKWIDKTLYVSSKPSKDAIEIPVAFKKLVCEGEATDDPQVDCDELLKALQESVQSGSVPGMMGLAAVPDNYPPDWCDDCEEKLVKASAYVTDSPVEGSKPFKVKVKVLVCETSTEPKIDCEEIIKALGEGMRRRRSRTMNGLSEATMTKPASTTTKSAPSGSEFDYEANKIDPTRKSQQASSGSLWWLWLMLAGGAVYAARKL